MTNTVRIRMKDAASAYRDGTAPLRALIGSFKEPNLRTERGEDGELRIIGEDGALIASFSGSAVVAEPEDECLNVYLVSVEPIQTSALGDIKPKPMTPARLQAENRRRFAKVGDPSGQVRDAVSAARKTGRGLGALRSCSASMSG
jgi:hypothetical protein